MSTPWGPDATDQDYLRAAREASRWIAGHCRDGYHMYCGGEERDRGDGTVVRCECPCHQREEEE